ncbi:MAG: hypothetical protein LC792_02980 [Actinobacteria bacterium]|nr:hypothetical protein [Actinomycetota bacterium]
MIWRGPSGAARGARLTKPASAASDRLRNSTCGWASTAAMDSGAAAGSASAACRSARTRPLERTTYPVAIATHTTVRATNPRARQR